jgi:hypothetical protein
MLVTDSVSPTAGRASGLCGGNEPPWIVVCFLRDSVGIIDQHAELVCARRAGEWRVFTFLVGPAQYLAALRRCMLRRIEPGAGVEGPGRRSDLVS